VRNANGYGAGVLGEDGAMDLDEYAQVLEEVRRVLSDLVEQDWSRRAGALEWTCWQTVDHMLDCLLSYAMQVAGRVQTDFLPFGELHAEPEASNQDLLAGLGAVGQIFHDVVSRAEPGITASDGLVSLDVGDWCATAAYELVLHAHDVAIGLGVEWELPSGLCSTITASPALWMFDRALGEREPDPWLCLVVGSGRLPRR
jgi:DinB superfamily